MFPGNYRVNQLESQVLSVANVILRILVNVYIKHSYLREKLSEVISRRRPGMES